MNNIKKIRNTIPELGCDAVLLTNDINRLYATGFKSSAGALIITKDEAWFIIDFRYVEAARQTVAEAQVVQLPSGKSYGDIIESTIKDNGIKSVGFEDTLIPFSTHKEWLDKFGAELIPAQKKIDDLRNVKSRADIEQMIKAQRISEKAFAEVLALISTDMTEKEIAAELIYRMLKNGADDKAFNPIVVSGTKSSRPHGVPGDEKISEGFLTIDFGANLGGWCSDTTRTLCVGKPDDEMVKVYDTVLKAQLAGIAAVHGGVKGVDVDAAARDVIQNAGYGDHFDHGFSHSIGLEVHETLKASLVSKDILPVGAVISAEPGIYLPGRYGVRIEDTLYITEDGCENITNLPKELVIL
ncbi:MAG: Xaa-Pro peptidase family protein [Oscillospiraceae bacterium]|nr:Xaa-Pro peptidase family protein [Oscillospiraceae bacterium]MCL2278805.1 Xaa-Pro peptidase family protein [Oscillospiraceae bacterium]